MPTEVKLMPEFTADLPLWLCEWWELDLSAQLLDQLADWQAVFDEHYDARDGWGSDSVRAAWKKEGERLARRLREDLPRSVELHVDLWPVQERG